MSKRSDLNPNAQPYVPACQREAAPAEKMAVDIQDDKCEEDCRVLVAELPHISEEIIIDFYFMSNGDLEETKKMLLSLQDLLAENVPAGSTLPEHLPETLEIGDARECSEQEASRCSHSENP